MKTLKIAFVIALFSGLNAFAGTTSNCQAKQDSNLDKNKAVKTQEATQTVYGNAQSAPKKQQEGSKTIRETGG